MAETSGSTNDAEIVLDDVSRRIFSQVAGTPIRLSETTSGSLPFSALPPSRSWDEIVRIIRG